MNELATEDPLQDRYLDTLNSAESNTWEISIELQGQPITFKVDAGAEITAVSTSTWESLKLST